MRSWKDEDPAYPTPYGEVLNRWGVEEWRETLIMITYFRRLLKEHPLEGDKPERAQRLARMSKDTAVKIYEELRKLEEDIRQGGPVQREG